MTNAAIATTIRQMLNDWNNATKEQRRQALEAAAKMVEKAAQ